jgi:hypothetical protein
MGLKGGLCSATSISIAIDNAPLLVSGAGTIFIADAEGCSTLAVGDSKLAIFPEL